MFETQLVHRQNVISVPFGVEFRKPEATDGPAIHALIAACPPLDSNSLYCNLLQASHFANTCVVAEKDATIVGWISGYRPPTESDTLFIWQVAVSPKMRGVGLGARMISSLLKRSACGDVKYLRTTITERNKASWALFERVAKDVDASFSSHPQFLRNLHLGGKYPTEHLVTIGPMRSVTTLS